MSYLPSHLAYFVAAMTEAVRAEDVRRCEWAKQTDAVRLAAVVAQMQAEAPERIILVDGRIAKSVIGAALRSGDPKGFFNRRCHDARLTCRRLIVLDTKSTEQVDGRKKRRGGKANLHFHAVFMLDEGQDRRWLLVMLRKVFGEAVALGPRQFRLSAPDPEKHYTFGERQASGIMGKLCYMLSHAGATYLALDLNEGGKRSRKAPASRRRYNKHSEGLAAGIPSNFLSSVVICDNASKGEARKAFEAWMDAVRNPGRAASAPKAASTAHLAKLVG